MRRHRLDRLQKLAQGAAVISLGVLSTAACDKAGTPPEEPIHTNATAQPTPTPSTPPPDMTPSMNATATPPSPSVAVPPSARPHTINAPPNPSPIR